ncbi:MAG TPA: potassium-transporting ATPase subunit KdpA [Candidatus Eremiobacteraceae bacterium]|nr:potassium-transporting ATPase subunit KdpA [Candidatus Eremiobacteraceae bacterium]
MTAIGWLQAGIYFAIIVALTRPLGAYMARVFEGQKTILSTVLAPAERAVYRACRIDPTSEMSAATYLFAVLAFSFVGLLYMYALLRTQAWLPLNPQHFANVAPDLAWNTAVSFMTNTNWQFYSGESTMSYLTQMAGLAWHNFASAAVGITIAIAVIRGVTRTDKTTVGNFWVDVTRSLLYVLLPISVVGCLVLVSQGVPQNFHAYQNVVSIEGFKQAITGGPMASQEVIKELGTNGGGFVNANSASPNENPTAFSDLFEMLLIFSIGAALTYTYGRYAKDQRQGWALFAAMAILFAAGFTTAYAAESFGNPIVHQLGVEGGNLEGKETRFGVASSALFATVTTDTSCGAVNSWHDSFTPLGGLVPLADMQLGEVVFGGVGTGLYGMVLFVVLTVFIAGLMVGRTPEYLGKKIERRQVQLAIIGALVLPVFALVPTALSVVLPQGLATLTNGGPHGFSEILYGFTSTSENNGSAFGGLGGNMYYNIFMGVVMMCGRFLFLIPAVLLAGSMAGKPRAPESAGTFTTHSPIFVGLIIGVIIIVGALTFFPADALGPIVEHLRMLQGQAQ